MLKSWTAVIFIHLQLPSLHTQPLVHRKQKKTSAFHFTTRSRPPSSSGKKHTRESKADLFKLPFLVPGLPSTGQRNQKLKQKAAHFRTGKNRNKHLTWGSAVAGCTSEYSPGGLGHQTGLSCCWCHPAMASCKEQKKNHQGDKLKAGPGEARFHP